MKDKNQLMEVLSKINTALLSAAFTKLEDYNFIDMTTKFYVSIEKRRVIGVDVDINTEAKEVLLKNTKKPNNKELRKYSKAVDSVMEFMRTQTVNANPEHNRHFVIKYNDDIINELKDNITINQLSKIITYNNHIDMNLDEEKMYSIITFKNTNNNETENIDVEINMEMAVLNEDFELTEEETEFADQIIEFKGFENIEWYIYIIETSNKNTHWTFWWVFFVYNASKLVLRCLTYQGHTNV